MSPFPHSESNWILAHCDGGSRGNPGPSGFGAQITDAQGNTLAELSEYLGVRTNNFAEYSGLLAVLEWALKNGHTHLRVISDSELMVKQIQGKYKVNSPDLKVLWQQARERIARLQGFEITHALRHKNKAADALANQAMDKGTRRGAVSSDPTSQPVRRRPDSTPAEAPAPRPREAVPSAPAPARHAPIEVSDPRPRPTTPTMLRGFTRDGVIHVLGGAALPDGVFVKIICE